MKPFSKGDTLSTFTGRLESVLNEIRNLDNDYFLNASKVELEEYYMKKALIVELALDIESIYLDNKKSVQVTSYNRFSGRQFDVPGTSIDLCIPFSGNEWLFELRASTYSLSGYPEILISGNLLIITIAYQDADADGVKIKKSVDSDLKRIVDAVEYINKDVREHNSKIELSVKKIINNKLDEAKKSLDVLGILDIPIRRKDKPEAYVIDVKRKVRTSQANAKPKASIEKFCAEPYLELEEYNHILGILRGMSTVIERSPDSFSSLDEEAIRTHFLLQLNGHYEGSATGETFNKSGKTDILIRVEDKNIFIGECKFWKGPKSFDKAIDQLLGYLAWRDTKCALLIFNRNKNSTDVSLKMHKIMSERIECKKVVENNVDGDSKYIFVKTSDPGREIWITTQLYDLPNE